MKRFLLALFLLPVLAMAQSPLVLGTVTSTALTKDYVDISKNAPFGVGDDGLLHRLHVDNRGNAYNTSNITVTAMISDTQTASSLTTSAAAAAASVYYAVTATGATSAANVTTSARTNAAIITTTAAANAGLLTFGASVNLGVVTSTAYTNMQLLSGTAAAYLKGVSYNAQVLGTALSNTVTADGASSFPSGSVIPFFGAVPYSSAGNPIRYADTFKDLTGIASTTGQSFVTVWTPASGKKFRILAICIRATNDFTISGGGYVTGYFVDSASGATITSDCSYAPANANTASPGAFEFTDRYNNYWMRGKTGSAANASLLFHIDQNLTNGKISVHVAGVEE